MIESDGVASMVGAVAFDPVEDRIGEVSQVYIDAELGRPTWISVRLALLSSTEVLVPLTGASWDHRDLRVSVMRDTARSAPRIEMDEPLTTLEQERLYAHYGIPSMRHPRSPLGELQVDEHEISYSVRDDTGFGDDGFVGEHEFEPPRALIRS